MVRGRWPSLVHAFGAGCQVGSFSSGGRVAFTDIGPHTRTKYTVLRGSTEPFGVPEAFRNACKTFGYTHAS